MCSTYGMEASNSLLYRWIESFTFPNSSREMVISADGFPGLETGSLSSKTVGRGEQCVCRGPHRRKGGDQWGLQIPPLLHSCLTHPHGKLLHGS